MKQMTVLILSMVVLSLGVTGASAQQGPIETVANGCKAEIEKYCSQVTPGQSRVLACLYAHGEKVSSQCEYALYDAAAQLERAVAALSYVVNECAEDLEKFCGSVDPGQGRLADCLKKNDKQVSSRCKQAQKDVGLQ